MIEDNASKNYLLNYKEGGDLGPMRIIRIDFAVDADSYDKTMEWLREKILRNEREFTLGEYGPFKEEPVMLTVDTDGVERIRRQLSEESRRMSEAGVTAPYFKEPAPTGLRTYAEGGIVIGNPYEIHQIGEQDAGINPPSDHL